MLSWKLKDNFIPTTDYWPQLKFGWSYACIHIDLPAIHSFLDGQRDTDKDPLSFYYTSLCTLSLITSCNLGSEIKLEWHVIDLFNQFHTYSISQCWFAQRSKLYFQNSHYIMEFFTKIWKHQKPLFYITSSLTSLASVKDALQLCPEITATT